MMTSVPVTVTVPTTRHNTHTLTSRITMSMSMMMFLFLAAVISLREAEAFTISSIPIRHRHRHRHRHMRPSVALNVAMDPRTLGLNDNLNLNEFNHNLNNLNQLDHNQQLSQKDEFPLPHSTNPYIILGIRHTPSTTISELKSAYRRAVLLYHPDTRDQFWEYGNNNSSEKEKSDGSNDGNDGNDGKEAYSDFRRINAAYETIYTTLFGFAPCTRVSSRLNP
eukprot:914262_1